MEVTNLINSASALWTSALPIVVSVLALIVSGLSLAKRVQANRYELYWEVLKSYHSPEMLKALRHVWEFVDKECKMKKEKIRTKYLAYFKRGDDSLHADRRVVSTLFQQLAFLRDNHLIPRKFKKTLPNLDLRIIEYPDTIEEEGIPSFTHQPQPIKREDEGKNRMYPMYNDWLRAQGKPTA